MLVRISEPDRPAFLLRKGEEGISVFDLEAVQPPLMESEILNNFRTGSLAISRSLTEIEAKGLQVVPVFGAATLAQRLREAHAEIRPGPAMTRAQFKKALKELE